jgi:hypothetical protein
VLEVDSDEFLEVVSVEFFYVYSDELFEVNTPRALLAPLRGVQV